MGDLQCGLMNKGWGDGVHYTNFGAYRPHPGSAHADIVIDRGSWILSALPPQLYIGFTRAYNGSYADLADEINQALAALEPRILWETLGWYYDEANANREVCWQKNYKLALSQYANAAGALNSLLVSQQDSSHSTFLTRPKKLPALDLNQNISRCVDPDTAQYRLVERLLGEHNNGRLDSFQKMADDIADPFALAISRGALAQYRCGYSSGCSAALYRDIPFLPSTFESYFNSLGLLIKRKKSFCIVFDEVKLPRGEFTIAATRHDKGGPLLFSPDCRSRPCYDEYNLLEATDSKMCDTDELGDELPVYTTSDVFSNPPKCGTRRLAIGPDEYGPVCECALSMSFPSKCEELPCYRELLQGNRGDFSVLEHNCARGYLSSNKNVAYDLVLFRPEPQCGQIVMRFSAEERRSICECSRGSPPLVPVLVTGSSRGGSYNAARTQNTKWQSFRDAQRISGSSQGGSDYAAAAQDEVKSTIGGGELVHSQHRGGSEAAREHSNEKRPKINANGERVAGEHRGGSDSARAYSNEKRPKMRADGKHIEGSSQGGSGSAADEQDHKMGGMDASY